MKHTLNEYWYAYASILINVDVDNNVDCHEVLFIPIAITVL